MDADALLAAQRQANESKLPLWYGDSRKDVFTPDEYIERLERAKDAGTWGDPQALSYVFNAL